MNAVAREKLPSMVFATFQRKHQEEAFIKLRDEKYDAYLMEPGTGKSKCAIDKAVYLYLNKGVTFVFIVAPNGVDEQWAKEQIPTHCGVVYEILLWKGLTSRKDQVEFDQFCRASGKLKFFCINVETFSRDTHIDILRYLIKRFNSYVVLDEASRIKNPESKRTQNLCYGINEIQYKKSLTRSGYEDQVVDQIVHSAAYSSILTGSLVTNSPFDIFAPFNFIKYDFFGMTWFAFRARYGIETKEKSFGTKEFLRPVTKAEIASIKGYIKKGWTIEQVSLHTNVSESSVKYIKDHPELKTPYKNLDELKIKITPYSYTRTLQECYDIPDPVREVVYVPMSKEQSKIYFDTKEDLLSDMGNLHLTVKAKIALITRLSQITSGFYPSTHVFDEEEYVFVKEYKLTPMAENKKIQAVFEELTEYSFDKPLLCFGRFASEIEAYYDFFKSKRPDLTVEKYYGQTSKEDRALIKAKFQDGQIDILFCSDVAGIGLNLQISNKAFFTTNTASWEMRNQKEGRIFRLGQDTSQPVLFKDYVHKGTVDERILEILKSKKDLAEYFQDHNIREFLG